MPETIKSIELFFQEQPSDKVYNVALVKNGEDDYTVHVQWGRRGSSLSKGTKALGATLAAAEKAYDKVVRQKTKKGYEVVSAENKPAEVAPPSGEGSASKVASDQRARLAQRAQLLNALDDAELDALLSHESVIAQQKLDGMRVLVHIREGAVVATNREGQITTMARSIEASFRGAPEGTVFDGELVSVEGSATYWVFDLLGFGDEDLRELGYVERYERLRSVGVETDNVSVVPTAFSSDEKRKLFAQLEKQSAEGIVFKERDAPYTAGRPASGGAQRKYKFVKSADVVITANAGNAYQMAVHDPSTAGLREVGKVFAGTTNDSRAELDDKLKRGETPIAEVKYLYATDDKVLFQPVFVRLRDDKAASDCTIEQLVQTDRRGLTEI